MPESPSNKTMRDVILADGRYPLEAFAFLHDGLSRAVQSVHGENVPPVGQSHVTGQQLCHALCELALEKWGMLARTVLGRWNIRQTIDFGNMVYLLVENDFMKKTEEDSLEDFRNVFDFDDFFNRQWQFELKE
jgi:uncharacterized repeat protein (TIGR04138 family)